MTNRNANNFRLSPTLFIEVRLFMRLIASVSISLLFGIAVFELAGYVPMKGIDAFSLLFSKNFLKLAPIYLVMLAISLPILFITKKYLGLTIFVCIGSVSIATIMTSLIIIHLLKVQDINIDSLAPSLIVSAMISTLIYGTLLWVLVRNEHK